MFWRPHVPHAQSVPGGIVLETQSDSRCVSDRRGPQIGEPDEKGHTTCGGDDGGALLARMPDPLRISIDGDRPDRLFVYDGKQFTMLARRVNFYATVPGPPTIAQLADMMDERHASELPLEELLAPRAAART
jgi:hypothetical protein